MLFLSVHFPSCFTWFQPFYVSENLRVWWFTKSEPTNEKSKFGLGSIIENMVDIGNCSCEYGLPPYWSSTQLSLESSHNTSPHWRLTLRNGPKVMSLILHLIIFIILIEGLVKEPWHENNGTVVPSCHENNGRATTVHNLVSCSNTFQNLLWFMHGQSQNC